MTTNRREFLKRGALLLPAAAIAPQILLNRALGAPPGAIKNVIFLELFGGNDGINTVVPFGVDGGTYYTEFRSSIAIPETEVLKFSGAQVGFHPAMPELKAMYDAGRVAVVQGASYPSPSFSHEVARKIWYTGDVNASSPQGWLARYLNLFPVPSFPCTAEIQSSISGLLAGSNDFVPALNSLGDFEFPADYAHSEDAQNRKAAFTAIASALSSAGGSLGALAKTSSSVIDLIDTFATVPGVTYVGDYPDHYFSYDLKLAVRLLAAGLGIRFLHVGYGGFDTHDAQNADDYHGSLLSTLSKGVAAVHADLVALGLDQDTLIVVFTEFGRTVYENGSGGTDHGSVQPVLVIGNSVNGGLTTPHPSMNPANLTGDNEPPSVVDFRDVFGTLLAKWYGATAGELAQVFPGYTVTDVGFLP